MVNVLFVCLGNICRSPAAEGVFRALVEGEGLADRITVDSAGTAAWHLGKPPDRRAQAAARRRGIDIGGLRARQAGPADFRRFDLVLAMDRDNHADLARLCPPGEGQRLALFLDFAPEIPVREVPDPYYGGPEGFERMLDLIDIGGRGLLAHLRATRLRPDR
ncbi:MAG: low molecular weight protein-tyrosine-phosphatase [Rhodospirillales bacterium]